MFASISQLVVEGDVEAIVAELDNGVTQIAAVNRTVSGEALPVTSGGDGISPDMMLETWSLGGAETPVFLKKTGS